jgi:peptidoglycan/xylan/chitin deacetylase (PgdA/CDA1 family)
LSANWLCLKYLPGLRKWGVYREMRAEEWLDVFRLLERHRARLTVSVTAAWAESAAELIPFPKRFPEEAAALKEGCRAGLLEIANHGLCHCVLAENLFKPKWFSGNRRYHREFWDWIPSTVQEDHIRRAQDILQGYFQTEIVTFVPPGSVFTEETLEIAGRYGLRYVSCQTRPRACGSLVVVGEEDVTPLHDRDIVLRGTAWFERLLQSRAAKRLCRVRDLGAARAETARASGQAALHLSSAERIP